MGRGRIALILVAMTGVVPALAQSPIAISSQVESGWTSNATDSAAGGEDFYVTHSHDLSLTGRTDNLLLRGSLSISQTRFATTQFEDDAAVTGAVEGELALGADAVLRLGYAVTQNWTGDDLGIGALVVPVRSSETQHEYLAEFTLRGIDQQVVVAVTGDWALPGDSVLDGLGLPPLRLPPIVGSVAGKVNWERALTPNLAVLTGMEAWFTLIPEVDQLTYLRAPADGGRVSAGLRLADGTWTAEGKGGVDLVWPKGFSALTRTMPYIAVAASVVPMAGVTLAASGETGVELADPADGVAGRTAAIDLGATWMLMPEVTLSASLAGQQEWGLFDTDLVRSVRMAALGARYAVSERFTYRAMLTWSRHAEPDEQYDKAGLALSLRGDF
ncbi:hypothetical protein [Devosia ginsengisoli]|uniref:Porin n=1 Tax=Devosia ginsengisoli TaxID=400770 RepID=A0A5B8LS35_9HYPH|nr:hypothetical protein [Devosia ginsengisoli]QDZ10983.1 hypothetical protein FPZ08_09600 [Devosia ginsengisoli]